MTDKPADMVPSNLTAFGAAGVLWRGTEDNAFTASAQPFVEVDAVYGDPDKGHSRTPYDAFAMKLRFGGGSGLSEARVRGRLLGQPLKDERSSSVSCRVTTSRKTTPTPPDPNPSRAHSGSHRTCRPRQVLDAGLGRPDRPRRHRFAPARPDRNPRRRRSPETRVRAFPRGRAITTTDLDRTLA